MEFRFRFNSVMLGGGVAIPYIPKIKSELAIGDFPAYKMCKEDKEFMAIMLQQYRTMQGECESKESYLSTMLNECIKEEFERKSLNIFTLGIIGKSLSITLSGQGDVLSNIEEYIKYFEDNPYVLLNHKLISAKVVLFSVIEYLAIERGEYHRAKLLYDEVIEKLNNHKKNESIGYHIKQCEHLFGISDNREFLVDRSNIKPSEEWPIWSIFDEYYEIEENINNKILRARLTS